MPHRTENCGIKCSFCSGLGHSEDRCWKRSKDGRPNSGAVNFLEVLLDDEAATAQQLDRLCGNENVFSYTHIPRRRMPVEVPPTEVGTSTETDGKGDFDFEEGCRICIVQDADGRQWERSWRDMQIFYAPPD